jgi:hypothetical protein
MAVEGQSHSACVFSRVQEAELAVSKGSRIKWAVQFQRQEHHSASRPVEATIVKNQLRSQTVNEHSTISARNVSTPSSNIPTKNAFSELPTLFLQQIPALHFVHILWLFLSSYVLPYRGFALDIAMTLFVNPLPPQAYALWSYWFWGRVIRLCCRMSRQVLILGYRHRHHRLSCRLPSPSACSGKIRPAFVRRLDCRGRAGLGCPGRVR